MKLAFALLLVALPFPALADGVAPEEGRPEQLAVLVGANIGSSDDDVLRYAESDAKRMRSVLVELGGVRPDRTLLVLGGGPNDVLRALTEALGRASELAASGRPVSLFFYYSGHGDEESLHLPHGTLALADLRHAIAQVPAALHITVLDACRGNGRDKGVHLAPVFSTTATPEAVHGSIELRASSMGESAQESEELGASVFTHFFVSGLRGAADVDADRRVTLAEAYAYAYRQTLLRTGARQGPQHPTLSVELGGAGEVVLSWLARGAATLSVPGGADRYLVFQLPGAAVLAELDGESARSIVLPSGRYLIARRTGDRAGVAEVDLSWGGSRTLQPGDFRAMSREQLIARGGRIELRRFRLELRPGLELAFRAPEQPALSMLAAFSWARGPLELQAAAGYVGGPARLTDFRGWEHAIVGRLSAGLRLFVGRVTFVPSIGIEARYAFERIDSEYGAQTAPLTERFRGGALGPDAALEAVLSLPRHWVLVPVVSFAALVRREAAVDARAWAFHPTLSFALGVGRAF